MSSGTRLPAPAAPTRPHAVSRPHDAAEREADRAAAVVAHGGHVLDWSFTQVATGAPVQRQHHEGSAGDAPSGNEAEYREAAETTLEAVLETPVARRVIDRIMATPEVRAVKDAVTSPVGIGVGAALGVAAVGVGIGATVDRRRSGRTVAPEDEITLPVQPPAIPLDVITPGLSARVVWEGPVDAPTNAGLSISWSPPGPTPDRDAARRRQAAATARQAEELRTFRANMRFAPGSREARDREAEEAAIARWIASQTFDPARPTAVLPLTGGAPRVVPGPLVPLRQEPREEEPAAPVQREADGVQAHVPDTSGVDRVTATPGVALDPEVRDPMEAAFGWSFAGVRVHHDAVAATAAREVGARAFTRGPHVAFAPGAYRPDTPQGRRTIAHELAHVVQQGAASHTEERP